MRKELSIALAGATLAAGVGTAKADYRGLPSTGDFSARRADVRFVNANPTRITEVSGAQEVFFKDQSGKVIGQMDLTSGNPKVGIIAVATEPTYFQFDYGPKNPSAKVADIAVGEPANPNGQISTADLRLTNDTRKMFTDPVNCVDQNGQNGLCKEVEVVVLGKNKVLQTEVFAQGNVPGTVDINKTAFVRVYGPAIAK